MKDLLDRIEAYDFECVGGPLKNCTDWQELRALDAMPEHITFHCTVTGVRRVTDKIMGVRFHIPQPVGVEDNVLEVGMPLDVAYNWHVGDKYSLSLNKEPK